VNIMVDYTKDYINRKIENCEKLIITAISEDQRIIYQEYCDFWTEKLDKSKKSTPGPVVEKSEETMGDIWKDVNKMIDTIIEPEADHAVIFEADNPNKQAYYNRGGETHKTKAFKEYLKSVTK